LLLFFSSNKFGYQKVLKKTGVNRYRIHAQGYFQSESEENMKFDFSAGFDPAENNSVIPINRRTPAKVVPMTITTIGGSVKPAIKATTSAAANRSAELLTHDLSNGNDSIKTCLKFFIGFSSFLLR
jgi:hypothetical protein